MAARISYRGRFESGRPDLDHPDGADAGGELRDVVRVAAGSVGPLIDAGPPELPWSAGVPSDEMEVEVVEVVADDRRIHVVGTSGHLQRPARGCSQAPNALASGPVSSPSSATCRRGSTNR